MLPIMGLFTPKEKDNPMKNGTKVLITAHSTHLTSGVYGTPSAKFEDICGKTGVVDGDLLMGSVGVKVDGYDDLCVGLMTKDLEVIE